MNSLTTRQPTELEVQLSEYAPQFAAVLPAHISVDKFRRIVLTSLNQNPDLVKADRRSLFSACVRAAQDGLLPDGREAALVVFNTKDRKTGEWKKLITYMPMIEGIYKRLRNSGEVASLSSYVVFENDKFDYELGDNPRIEHKPAMGERGQPIGAYAIAKLTNGEVLREVASFQEIEKVRAVSRAANEPNGPWVQWWEQMARKTITRRLAKRLPGSADLDEMLRREDEQYQPQPNGAAVPAQRPTRAMFHPAVTDVPDDDEPPHDAETGEIEDGPTLSLVEQGDAKSEEGIEALEGWWKSLTPSQRGELGAKGRSPGPHLEGWKMRAQAADERGGPAPEDTEQEESDQNLVMEQDQREQNGPAIPTLETYPDDPDKLNWGAWCAAMVSGMRDAEGEHLAALRKACGMYPTAPDSIRADLDRAYDLRVKELRV